MRVKSPSVFAACFLDRCETRSDLNFWRILKVKEKREPPRGKGGQHGLIDKRFRTKRIVTLREYIYIYTLDVLYTVPTVFLGLNKLLLFGTKIVTLFGQRKNVFVKQKHSGQEFKFFNELRFVDVACVFSCFGVLC